MLLVKEFSQLANLANGPSFSDIGNLLTGLGTLVLAAGAVFAALMAVNSYRAQVEVNKASALEQRGRWLMDLQKQFMNEATFRAVRCRIYDERCNGRGQRALSTALRRKQALQEAAHDERKKLRQLSDVERAMLVELDGYLNFLGMIKQLIDNGSINFDDAARRFGWYASEGLNVDSIMAEVRKNFPDVLEWQTQLRSSPPGRY